MPTVTTKLESTKQDMRKGRKTGSPVSGWLFGKFWELRMESLGRCHTRMKSRIDNLLGFPELGSHELSLSCLVGYQGTFCLLESSSADEECPGEKP